MKKLLLSFFITSLIFPLITLAQFGNLDETGDYYLTMMGGEIDTSNGQSDFWSSFVKINLDGDSLSYFDLYSNEGDSGKIKYTLDDSNNIALSEEDSVFMCGLMSQDGQITAMANTNISDMGLFASIKTSSGASNDDFSGDYFGGMFDIVPVYDYNKQQAYNSSSNVLSIHLTGEGTGQVFVPEEQEAIDIFYDVEDNGFFTLSGYYDEDSTAEIVPLFAGVLSPDRNLFSMAWTYHDSTSDEFQNRIIVGSKKSSGMNNASVQGEYRYYQMFIENMNGFALTQITKIYLDGAGKGTYEVLQQPVLSDSLESGTLAYTVAEDGALQVVPDNQSKQENFLLNGFVSEDGKMFVLTYMDTVDYSESLFGVGIARPTTPTSIETDNDAFPSNFVLEQNYPNPFNPETVINYQLNKKSDVELSVYNSVGQKIATLVEGQVGIGKHQVHWLGKNDLGEQVASGVYFYRLKTDFGQQIRKMILIR